MNKARRKELEGAVKLCEEAKEKLDEAEEIVQACRDEEEECYYNLPENLQEGERGERMQEVIDELDEFLADKDCVCTDIDSLIEHIGNATE